MIVLRDLSFQDQSDLIQVSKELAEYPGYIDVGDGCWRPNVLVTSLRCWWPIQDIGVDLIH